MQPSHPKEEFNVSLKKLNSWHIGGNAERFFKPNNLSELKQYLQHLPIDVPITWLGLGSNMLIRDQGVMGSVILTRDLKELTLLKDGSVYAMAGVSCAKFARFCVKHGFCDAAFFAGIPGTIGGALAMNAGAFGGQTWENVAGVELINRQGQIVNSKPDDFVIEYRHIQGKTFELHDYGFIGATFTFSVNQAKNEDDAIKKLLRQRGDSQPIGSFSCGSVFKNPQGDYAARLIEASGLKGHRIGNVGISDKHANFILNYGQGCSQEIESLMSLIEKTVLQDSGILLEPEVRIIGTNKRKEAFDE